MPVLDHCRSADRAILIRQIETAAIGTVLNELAVLAMRTAPMRRQRIDLRNIRHRSDEGRTDRSPGANKIAIIQRLFYQPVRNQIKHRETMPDDWCKLLNQSVLNHLRQIFSIKLACLRIRHILYEIIRPWNHW